MVMGFKTEIGGRPTHFAEQIRNGTKIHSIRKSNRWKPGMLIHPATGVRTPNYKLITGGPLTCISTQDIEIRFVMGIAYIIRVDSKKLSFPKMVNLANNDGFNECVGFKNSSFDLSQFSKAILNLHSPTDLNGFFKGQIVHWTDYRY